MRKKNKSGKIEMKKKVMPGSEKKKKSKYTGRVI